MALPPLSFSRTQIGLACARPLCNEVLRSPILTVHCDKVHAFHAHCLPLVTRRPKQSCISCDGEFNLVTKDKTLERLAERLYELGRIVLTSEMSYYLPLTCSPKEEIASYLYHKILVDLMHKAIQTRNLEVVDYLNDTKEKFFLKQKLEFILSAYKKKDSELLRRVLQPSSCLLDEVFYSHLVSFLHNSIQQGEYEIADCLLEVQQIPRLPNRGMSLMYIACRKRDQAMVAILLKHGVSCSEKNDLRWMQSQHSCWRELDIYQEHEATPLECAAKNGDLHIVDQLLEAGAEIDQCGSLDRTPLLHAVCARQEVMALYLIDCGASVHVSDREDRPLVSHAILGNLPAVVKKLIQKGVFFGLPYYQREGTSVHDAASIDNPVLLYLILKNKGTRLLTYQTLNKETPLMVAVRYGCVLNVRVFLLAGANPLFQNDRGKTALDRAQKYFQRARTYLLIDSSEEARKMVVAREIIFNVLLNYASS